MVAYWMIVFLGLGILFGILRQSVVPMAAGNTAFVVELVLGMPLQVCLLVFSACWTLFYRELEARRAAPRA
jgi:ABC-type amino acid transport system permease subunit